VDNVDKPVDKIKYADDSIEIIGSLCGQCCG
jgi:hypothetical protein